MNENDPKNCRYTDRKPNVLNRLTFGDFTSIILKGSWDTIGAKDLNPLYTNLTSQDASERLLRIWRRKYHRAKPHNRDGVPPEDGDLLSGGEDSEVLIRPDARPTKINMVCLVLRAFWPHFLLSAVCRLAQLVVDLLPPFLIGYLLDVFKHEETPDRYGYYVAGVLFTAQQISSFLTAHIYATLYNIGIKCRSGFSSAIYQKALRLSSKSMKEYSTGDVVNMISVDLENVMWSVAMSATLWSSPINIIITFVMIYQYLGIYSLAAVIMLVIFAPFSAGMAQIEASLQTKHMKKKDERIELLSELFNNIKVIKLYAWENSFMERVKKIRAGESRLMYIYLGACNAFGFTWNCFPFIISAAAIGAYMFLDKTELLTPRKVLVSLAYFSAIRMDLTNFPYAVSLMVKCVVSLKRIRTFLEADEVDPSVIRGDGLGEDEEIAIKNATFSWTEEDGPVLKDVNLSIRKGELVAVVGSVAAGKSSLIQAIIGEMRPSTGSIHRRETAKLAYVPQQAWILNNTIRQNIIFDKPFRGSTYQDLVRKCCLVPDLEIFPAGDATEIGEKGINLSGGQKQRISIARAVYEDADIYLLDDPLSAVDAHVAQSLFAEIIGPDGLLRRKTRLLVTHSIAVLPKVDRIIVLDEGRITHSGTYEQIMQSNVRIKELIETHANVDNDSASLLDHEDATAEATIDRPLKARQRLTSIASVCSTESGAAAARLGFSAAGRITEEEEMQLGQVRWSVYFEFFWKFGIITSFIVLAGYTVFRLADALSLLYITKVTTTIEQRGNLTTRAEMWKYMEIYLAFGGVQAVSIMIGLTALSIGCIQTSSSLHNRMLYAVLRAPMSFFDSTPVGRILNRFSRDVDEIDLRLYSVTDGYLETVVGLVIYIGLMCYYVPSFVAILLPLVVLFFAIQKFYVAFTRQVKRLNAITKSPVLNSFNESIAGAVSIRAYSMERNFSCRTMRLLDNNQNCVYHEYNGFRWLAIRLNTIGLLLDALMCCVLTYLRGRFEPEEAALILYFALETSTAIVWMVRLGAQVENSLVSAERVLEYGKTKSEADWDLKDEQVNPSWPSRGEVQLENYSTRYRENLKFVLHEVNLKINAGERVGIVGRTGAGKSSLTLALLRIIEPAEGRITIDGVDITRLGLHTLRSRIAMIPQDPVLFKGPLRDNVDPEGRFTDEQVWTSLERAHLKTKDKPISYQVEEGGVNLSVGERQLVCLARAMLRQSKLLILDEATAAVDMDTDALIQATIRHDFKDCTVITIAHRLHTIMDYDKIAVLDKGRVVEWGTPQELLVSTDGIFKSMAKDANIKSVVQQTTGSASTSSAEKIEEEETNRLADEATNVSASNEAEVAAIDSEVTHQEDGEE